MIYDLIRPYLSIRSRKKCSKKFFLIAENWKLDSQIFLLHSNFFLLRSQHGQIPLPRCSAKICYSPYVVLQLDVKDIAVTTCAGLCQRFEVWHKKLFWITPTIIAQISTQLCGRVSLGASMQKLNILEVRGFGSWLGPKIWV